jgi:hypothetical protein
MVKAHKNPPVVGRRVLPRYIESKTFRLVACLIEQEVDGPVNLYGF